MGQTVMNAATNLIQDLIFQIVQCHKELCNCENCKCEICKVRPKHLILMKRLYVIINGKRCIECKLTPYSKLRLPRHHNINQLTFPCDLCDYQADRGYSIKKHKRVVHEMSMETCFMCSKQVKSLYHHFRHFHKDQPELWEKYNMELKSDNDGWKRKQLFEKIIN